MTEVQTEIPSAFIKLEKLRSRHTQYFARRRSMEDRIRDIRAWIFDLEKRNEVLRQELRFYARGQHAPGTVFPQDQLTKNERSISVYRALLEIAQADAEEIEAMADDARLFENLRRHLQGELAAWGVE